MKKIILPVLLLLMSAAPAAAQDPNEIEGAYSACEGVRRACSRTPTPPDCTPQRVENCQVIDGAWKALLESRRAANHSKSIDGVAEQLRQKAKP